MKFLCVACDEPMKLTKTDSTEGAAGGSLSVLFSCPTCSQQVAMLTNPLETEMVRSLGVKIGPAEEAQPKAGGGCPFAAMVGEQEREKVAPPETPEDGLAWTTAALERLDKIPDFVRPMAKQGVEHYAKSMGRTLVDERILEEARARFGM